MSIFLVHRLVALHLLALHEVLHPVLVEVPRLQVPVEVAVHQVLLLVRHQEVLVVHRLHQEVLVVHRLQLLLYLEQIIG